MSPDPALVNYLPTGNKKANVKLPGEGGVFNPINLNNYCYAGNNPHLYIDPNGKNIFVRRTLFKFSWNEPFTVVLRALNGDTQAQYILKLAVVETGIQVSEMGSAVGNGMVICGMMSGNPVIIVVGAVLENVSDFSGIGFYFLKATLTEKPDDWEEAYVNLAIEFVSSGIADIAVDEIIANPATKKTFNKFVRKTFSNKIKGAFKKGTKEAGKKVIEQIIEEGTSFTIDKVYEYKKKEK